MRAHKIFWQVLCKLYDQFSGTSEVENKLLQKKALFLVTKGFGTFFLVLSSVTNLREQFIGLHKVF